ncbi:HU family DNA-binding protein [bacterium NHP-B]|jgi:DNA-binding protein HU-beta|nr:HU family DNA-binding protein [bacterium NHP-B]
MKKSEFVHAVSEQSGLTKVDAGKAVDAFASVIELELKRGGDVRLVNFGTFCVVKKKETEGRNPRTGSVIKIPARVLPKFKPGKGLKDAIAK